MIRRSMSRSQIAVYQVVAVYQVGGAPEIDLIDQQGRLYEGCTMVSMGGGRQDFLTIPTKGEEVLVVLDEGGAPYVLGALADQKRFIDKPSISDAGEYHEFNVALKDAALLAGDARVIASSSLDAVYLSPRVRVQGRLEVSNGGAPLQSLAIAEPLLETLNNQRDTIEAMRTILNIMGPYVAGLMSAAGDPQALNLTAALSQISSVTPPPHDTIASGIAKIER